MSDYLCESLVIVKLKVHFLHEHFLRHEHFLVTSLVRSHVGLVVKLLKEHSTFLEIGSFYNSPRVKQLSFTVFESIQHKMSLFPKKWSVPLNNVTDKIVRAALTTLARMLTVRLL